MNRDSKLFGRCYGFNFTDEVYFNAFHFDGFHTYWKNPGLVGVATTVNWQLPIGFSAGEIKWQVPERSKMLKYNCHGYKGETFLLVEIQAPDQIPDKFDIKARVVGMTCSEKSCCFVGYADCQTSLSKSTEKIFDKENQKIIAAAYDRIPTVNKDWESSFTLEEERIILTVKNDKADQKIPSDLYFFPEQNVYHTEIPQEIEVLGKKVEISFKLNGLQEKDMQILSGFLYNPKGWSSEGEKYLRIEAELTK